MHGTSEWTNDPSSNKFHPHLNASQFLILKVPRFSIPFLSFLFCFVLLCFSCSAFCSLCGLAHSPTLRACSWKGFNSSSGCPQGFLFPYPFRRLDFWLIHCLKFQIFPPVADPLPADLSIIELVVLLWLSSLPRMASSSLRPFLPCGPWKSLVFSGADPDCRLSSAGGVLSLQSFSCAFCWALVACLVSHFPFLSYRCLKSITLDSRDL